jgi:uncharacterized protein
MHAGRKGHREVVALLLDRGADLEAKNSTGGTALTWAAQARKWEVVPLLLDRGADASARGNNGYTAEDLCLRSGIKELRVRQRRGEEVEQGVA